MKSISSPFRCPNFACLWLGQTCLWLAEQGWFIGLTWWVLQKTGSGVAVGIVLMAGALPTALFALMGGAISDRFSPKQVAMVANGVNTLLAALLVFLIRSDTLYLPMLIGFSALAGLADAFAYPAISALMPKIVRREQLLQANTWIQGAEQLKDALGPALAGIAIAAVGLPLTFVFCTGLFALGSGLIGAIQWQPVSLSANTSHRSSSLIGEILEGIRYAWNHAALRFCLLLIAAVNLAANGPIVIGGAELALHRFYGDASTFGHLQAAFGIGSLAGVLLASRFSSIRNPGLALIQLAYGMALGLGALAFAHQLWIALIILAAMGLGCGIVSILALVWLQSQTHQHMQGRVMSLVMFAAVALDPLSQAFAGFVSGINLTALFVVSGLMMLAAAMIASLHRVDPGEPYI